jgi:hypothetical protein
MPTLQIWIWCVLFTLFFVVWRSRLQWTQNHVLAKINKSNVTAADYSVLLSNTGDADKNTLVEFGRHYGQVVAAFPVLSVGDVLTECQKVHASFELARNCDCDLATTDVKYSNL